MVHFSFSLSLPPPAQKTPTHTPGTHPHRPSSFGDGPWQMPMSEISTTDPGRHAVTLLFRMKCYFWSICIITVEGRIHRMIQRKIQRIQLYFVCFLCQSVEIEQVFHDIVTVDATFPVGSCSRRTHHIGRPLECVRAIVVAYKSWLTLKQRGGGGKI